MLLSVMVVGAGAATFGDQESITNKEAVDVCTTLNIIGGYEDGTFRPTGNVTRAEMSKMICVALNGGQEPTMGSGLIATFNDVAKDHWAAPYIEYCVSQGIVGGVGGGNFNPTGNITGTQAAKMLLCILGYNASIQGYVGSDYWETNINVDAAQKGLYAGLTNLDASAPLTRDQAAQMIWNALNAYEVEYKTTLVAGPDGTLTSKVTVQDKVVGNTNDKITLLEDKYEAKTFVGNFTAVSQMNTATMKDGYIRLVGALDSKGNPPTGNPAPTAFTVDFPSDLDIKYIGEEVKVLYLDKANDGRVNLPDDKDTIYGVYVTGNSTVVNAVKDDIDKNYATANKVSIDEKSYEVAANGTVVTNLGTEVNSPWTGASAGKSAIQGLGAVNGDTVKFILNDRNQIDQVYVTATTLNKVTAVSGTKISLTDIGTIDTAENGTSVYSGIAKDDVVTVTKLYDADADDATFVIEKATTVTSDVTGFSNNGVNNKTITMNGTVYKVYNETAMSNIVDDYKAALDENCLDKEFTLYLVNGYVRAAQEGADNMNQYAIVLDVNNGKLDSTFDEPRAELMLADGTKVNAVIHKDSKIYTTNDCDHATTPDNTYTDGSILDKVTALSTHLEKKQIVKYSVMSNGQYKIEECGNYGRVANGTELYNKDTTAFGESPIVTDGSCVLFYTNGSDMKVANLRSLGTIAAKAADTLYASVTNSSGKVIAAFIDYNGKPSGASSDTMYGIITSDGTVTTKGGDTYTMFNIWTGGDGDGTPVYVSGTNVSDLAKGKLVAFDKSADDIYNQGATVATKDFTILDGTGANGGAVGDGKAVAVTEYNETDNTLTYATAIKKDGNAYVADGKTPVAVDKDVKIVYVDVDAKKAGTSSGTVNTFDGTTGYANAMLVFEDDDATKKVVAVIVNTNVKTNVLGTKDVLGAATFTKSGSLSNVTCSDWTKKIVKGDVIELTLTAEVATDTDAAITVSSLTNLTADGNNPTKFPANTKVGDKLTLKFTVDESTAASVQIDCTLTEAVSP